MLRELGVFNPPLAPPFNQGRGNSPPTKRKKPPLFGASTAKIGPFHAQFGSLEAQKWRVNPC